MEDSIKFIVHPEEEGLNIREFLNRRGTSTTLIRKLSRLEHIKVDNCLPGYLPLETGQEISIQFEDEEIKIPSSPLNMEIVYEDVDLVVFDKPDHLPIMPCKMYPYGTFANQVASYFRSRGFHRKIRLVGRLDRHTTGLMMVAKNPYAHGLLSRDHTRRKVYEALVHGKLDGDLTIDAPILIPSDTLVRSVGEGGQRAVTHVKLLKSTEEYSYVQLTLETGRTHQIRVHMASVGHPLLGDELYGGELKLIQTPALHVGEMSFTQPRTGEEITLQRQPPEYFMKFISKIL